MLDAGLPLEMERKMALSRWFLIVGSLYLVVGISLGMHMGTSGDHTLAPVHAHINLLGFTLMTLFGLSYRLVPALAGSRLGLWHFWLFEAGVLVQLLALYILYAEVLPEATIGPVLGVAHFVVLGGIIVWLVNLWRSA